ncbi:MAG: SRPBCC family protein [Candidatus Thorarchaeota archaeon]|jgi:hypothetical protein
MKTHSILTSLTIDGSVKAVWDVITQPKLYIGYTDDIAVSHERIELGSTIAVTIGPSFYRTTYTSEVTHFEDGVGFDLEGSSEKGWRGSVRIRLTVLASDITEVTRHKEFEVPPGRFWSILVKLFLRRRYRKTEESELYAIKKIAESRSGL